MRFLVCLTALLASHYPATAQVERSAQVDVELVLAVDVSGSMSPRELRIQRRGYAEALRSDEVWNAIENGLIGAVAIVYVEWASVFEKKIIVPWRKISTRSDAEAFAEKLLTADYGITHGTSISGAISYGADQIRSNDWQGTRRVIDISGDGPNNEGDLVTAARDRAVADGIIINGLPIVAEGRVSGRGGFKGDLSIYYKNCVIGGAGSFMIPVTQWSEFSEAVRRKLVLELAGASRAALVHRVAGERSDSQDCEIGEKLRQKWLNR